MNGASKTATSSGPINHPRLTSASRRRPDRQAIETRVTVGARSRSSSIRGDVTAMTISDYPEYLALGYLLNQHTLPRRRGHQVTTTKNSRRRRALRRRTVRKAEEEGADLGLRQGGVRRPDGGAGERHAAAAQHARRGSIRSRTRSTPRPRSISKPARSTAACCAARPRRSLHGGRRPPQRRRQDRGLHV